MNITVITHLIAAAVAAAAAWFYQGAQMDAAVAKLKAQHAAAALKRPCRLYPPKCCHATI